MEVGGLAVGILPILAITIKAYHEVCSKIHTFRRSSEELRLIRDELHVRKNIFLNQCHHLLRLVVQSDGDAEEMLEAPSHKSWTDSSLTLSLDKRLRKSRESCIYIITMISSIINSLAAELGGLDRVVLQERKDGESVKDALRRLGQSAKFSFQKTRYDLCLRDLREYNEVFTQLVRDVREFERERLKRVRNVLAPQEAPKDIERIRSFSDKLHQAMTESWRCQESSHVNHFAKLCVDAEVDRRRVHLDMAICFDYSRTERCAAESEPPIWLYVQSEGIETEDIDSHRTKKRRVRFQDDVKTESPAASALPIKANEAQNKNDTTVNLCSSKSICCLLRKYQAPDLTRGHHCVGFLQTPLYKHLFFAGSLRVVPRRDHTFLSLKDLLSLDGLIQKTVEESYSYVDQLKLARSLATTTLRFSSTPWMSTVWRLHDLAIFGNHDQKFEDLLATLHLSSQISGQNHRAPLLPMEGIETVNKDDQALTIEQCYGVNNITLYSLGIALLKIGHWKPISKMRRPCDGDNDVLTARRLATVSRGTQLGPRYDDIVRRCLQCNFGFGTDLKDPSLQNAVWTDVVCQLEEMIQKLSISHTRRN